MSLLRKVSSNFRNTVHVNTSAIFRASIKCPKRYLHFVIATMIWNRCESNTEKPKFRWSEKSSNAAVVTSTQCIHLHVAITAYGSVFTVEKPIGESWKLTQKIASDECRWYSLELGNQYEKFYFCCLTRSYHKHHSTSKDRAVALDTQLLAGFL